MTIADSVPIALGVAASVWAVTDRLRMIAHDVSRKRLEAEEDDHNVTRKALAEARRRIIDLESQLPPGSLPTG
jgi:hypothetical protein